MRRLILHLIVWQASLVLLWANPSIVEGTITYVTTAQAYIDLGKKHGLNVGDTLSVWEGDQPVGVGLVVRAAASSSAIQSADSTLQWDIGYRVLATIAPPDTSFATVQKTLPSVVRKTTPSVFLDSSSYSSSTATDVITVRSSGAMRVRGYVSARYNVVGGTDASTSAGEMRLNGHLQIQNLGIPYLQLQFYSTASADFDDHLQEGNLYAVMLDYSNPDRADQLLAGRVYLGRFSRLGAVDGIGYTRSFESLSLGMLVGRRPQYGSAYGISGNKLGLMLARSASRYGVDAGLVLESQGQDLDRSYVLFSGQARFSRNLRLRGHSEIDLDIMDANATQNSASLTRGSVSINWQLPLNLRWYSGYDYRVNAPSLLDTTEAIERLAPRHSIRSTLSTRLFKNWSVSGFGMYRSDGSGHEILGLGTRLSTREWQGSPWSAASQVSYYESYLAQSGRLSLSVAREWTKSLDAEIYHEIYVYSLHGESRLTLRHSPELSLRYRPSAVVDRFRLRVRTDLEGGDSVWRITLSTSKQF